MLCVEGRVAAYSFISSVCITVCEIFFVLHSQWGIAYCFLIPLICIVLAFFVPFAPIVKRSTCLGIGFAVGLVLILTTSKLQSFGCYFACLCFFHFSEYLLTSIYNPRQLSLDSFLINHSTEYILAAVASWTEFAVELYFFPDLKFLNWISVCGLFLVIAGETLRKLAMITAGSNFKHIVQTRKAKDHRLVTNGIYQIMRHPSYSGWFFWSVGTQILLCNPVCLIGYTVASWNFFYDRIREEEYHLLQFFGEDYVMYMKEVGTGVPFNYGIEKEVKAFMTSQ